MTDTLAPIANEDAPQYARPETVIEPSLGWKALNLRELWQYRELIYFFTWRDIVVRYKQAVLGIAWAMLSPLATMIIYTILFTRVARIDTGSIPYPLFYFSAIIAWQFFAGGMARGGNSLVLNANLLQKVYFPRLIIPISAIAAGVVDLLITFVVFVLLMVWYHVPPSWALVLLPAFVALVAVMTLGVGLWLAALNVRYRDVGHIIPFLTQVWMFASPVVYPMEAVPAGLLRTLYSLNPMVGVVQGFRWMLAHGAAPDALAITASVVGALVLLVSGMYFFLKVEATFADVV